MTDYLKDSIALFTNERLGNESQEFETLVPNIVSLVEMVSTVTDLRSLPSSAFYSLIAVLIILLLMGSYFKSVLYRVIYTEKFQERPINVLIIIDAVVQHLCITFWDINSPIVQNR